MAYCQSGRVEANATPCGDSSSTVMPLRISSASSGWKLACSTTAPTTGPVAVSPAYSGAA